MCVFKLEKCNNNISPNPIHQLLTYENYLSGTTYLFDLYAGEAEVDFRQPKAIGAGPFTARSAATVTVVVLAITDTVIAMLSADTVGIPAGTVFEDVITVRMSVAIVYTSVISVSTPAIRVYLPALSGSTTVLSFGRLSGSDDGSEGSHVQQWQVGGVHGGQTSVQIYTPVQPCKTTNVYYTFKAYSNDLGRLYQLWLTLYFSLDNYGL